MHCHTLEALKYPTTFLFYLSLSKKKKKFALYFCLETLMSIFCIFFFSLPLSTFAAERVGLLTAVFRGLNSHAIWRRGSVVAADIDHRFTLYPRRWHKKKHHLAKRCLGFEHVKAIVTKNAIKVFVWTLLKVSF